MTSHYIQRLSGNHAVCQGHDTMGHTHFARMISRFSNIPVGKKYLAFQVHIFQCNKPRDHCKLYNIILLTSYITNL